MNKVAKILVLLGVCLASVAVLLSAFNMKALFEPFFKEPAYEIREFVASSDAVIEKLVIDTENSRVKINSTDSEVLRVVYSEGEKFRYRITEVDRVLTLIQESDDCFFNCWSFNFNIPEVVVEVPEGLVLAYDIDNDNANISVERVELRDSIFETSNAGIEMKGVRGLESSVVLKTSNGRINLSDFVVLNVDLKTSNGSIKMDGAEASGKLVAKTSNGKIEFSRILAGVIDLKTSNGSVSGSILGLATDFRKKVDTSNGKIEIDGVRYDGDLEENRVADRELIIKTSNGSVRIEFVD
jgi:hypothetical protein